MKRRWRHILITLGMLGILVAGCAIYAWFFGFQTMMVWEAHKIAKRAPVVRQTPHPLTDSSISPAPGTRLSYFGYEFEVPWDDLDPAKTKLNPTSVVLYFRSGNILMFKSLPPREFVNAVLGQMGDLRRIYGDAPFQSDYALWRLIVETTPEKVTPLAPRQYTVGDSMLLLIKAIAAPEASGLYSIQTSGFKGFQWGNPQSHPRNVVADFYDDDGGLEWVFMRQKNATAPALSQAEINRVLQTIHKSTNKMAAARRAAL